MKRKENGKSLSFQQIIRQFFSEFEIIFIIMYGLNNEENNRGCQRLDELNDDERNKGGFKQLI